MDAPMLYVETDLLEGETLREYRVRKNPARPSVFRRVKNAVQNNNQR